MKRLIAIILLAPALASAGNLDCPPFTVCYGTLTIDDNGEGSLGGAYWRALGPGYVTTGRSGAVGGVGQGSPYSSGTNGAIQMDDHSDGTLILSAYGIDAPPGVATAFMDAESGEPITHAGAYLGSFDLTSSISGCNSSGCTKAGFGGSGTGVIYVANVPDQPDIFYITGGKFTFMRAPEPSTASLLLIGFAGLALLARRRRPEHET